MSAQRAQASVTDVADVTDRLQVLNAIGGHLTLLPDAILSKLREAIVSGAFPPGTRLAEAQLARRLKTSRTPVRHALIQLEHEGLVVIVPHMGACVRNVTIHDVEEIYQIRAALEALATSLAAKAITRVGKAQLAEALNKLKAAAAALDQQGYAAELDAFHLLIMRLSGNRRLEHLYESIIGPTRRLRRINLNRQERVEESLRMNTRIARAIVAGDADAARLMSEHLARSCEQVKELAQRDESYSGGGGDA